MTDVQKSQSAPLLGGSPPTFEQRESELGSGDPQPQVTIETEVLPLSAKEQVNPEEQISEQPTDTRKDINPQTENPEDETSFSRTQRIVSEQVLNPISQMWRRATSGATNVIHPGDLPQPGQMAEKLRQSLPPASGVVDRVKENIPRAKEMMSNLAQTIPEKASGMVETLKQNAPQASGMVEAIRQNLPDVPSMEGITSDQANPETLKKQAVSLYFITAIPAVMTIYRAFLANEGPTWFSFHPTMMMVSITSLLTAMLLQRFGGKDNITLIGTLSVMSIISMIISIYAVWSAKEMYAKVHFLSIHSHFGGMTIFGLLIYALGAFYVFKPIEGAERVDRKWQQYLVTWGKGTATLALCSQLLGVIEIERTWTFLFIWMASLFLMTPFLILPWNKSDVTPRV